MDSLLAFGLNDDKLTSFLKRVGCTVINAGGEGRLADVVSSSVVDLILVDERMEENPIELCVFLREQRATKDVPIVYLGRKASAVSQFLERGLTQVEVLDLPYSVGKVVSQIATQLRLRKLAGADEATASLGQMNATLRELNNHFNAELKEARIIQQMLLPKKLPADERYSVAAMYQPLEEVGGDWYYWQAEKSGKISAHIADVTGHGLSAAFIGSMTKLALTAAAKELPHELLGEMNRLMAPQLPEGRFVTMFSYLYDPESGVLDFARAGHPPALCWRQKSGALSELKGEGFAVGFFEEAKYKAAQTTLEPEDFVVLLTDGIVEARNRDNKMYGPSQMHEVFAKLPAAADAEAIVKAIMDDFNAFRDGRILKDDTTLVVLKRLR